MANRRTRSSSRASGSAARPRGPRSSAPVAPTAPERVADWILKHAALLAGIALALGGVGFGYWASSGSMPLAYERGTVLDAFGGGVYLLAAVVVWAGTVVARIGARWPLIGGPELRRVVGLALVAIACWGAVGAIEPVVALGGVRLDAYGAGGQISTMLDSVLGWIVIAGGVLVATALLAPGLSRDGLAELRDAGRIAGRDLRSQGPGALAASGRSVWHGLGVFIGLLESGTMRGAQGLSRSVGRWADGRWGGEMNVNGAGGPLAAGPRASGGSGVETVARAGRPAVPASAPYSGTRAELRGRSTALAQPPPLRSELRAGFGVGGPPQTSRPIGPAAGGLRPWVATAPQAIRPTQGLAPDSVVARSRASAPEAPPVQPPLPEPAGIETEVTSLGDSVSAEPRAGAAASPSSAPVQEAPRPRPEPRPTAPETSAEARSRRTVGRTASDGWRLPPVELLDPDPAATLHSGAEDQARIIVQTLASFGVDATVTQINEGPAITQFGVEPGWEIKTRQVAVKDAEGRAVRGEDGQPLMRGEEVSRTRVRVNRITRLADDLALALAAPSIRIEAPVPGQPIVGIEVPNTDTRVVSLRGLVESPEFAAMVDRGGLAIALGRDVTGGAVIADLTKMPHVLIAGATGSGKSVCINTIISSLLMHNSPEQLRLILVDPKRVELTGYGSVPHLAFSHVVTEPDEVVSVLGVVVAEMDRRYRTLERSGARNIAAYNKLPSSERQMPYWVVVLDELADMMMAAPVDVERQLVRLAQLARAVGIHLVVATQRPSVDVVTGLIKANFPTRIAFATTSQTDARVIMDRTGAEKLMGRGDMLYMSSDSIKPRRVQGAYVSDGEIERLIASWTSLSQGQAERQTLDEMLAELTEASPEATTTIEQRGAQADLNTLHETLEQALPEEETDEPDIVLEQGPGDEPVQTDTRLTEAIQLAREYERVSATLLQRRMRIGRPRAERLIQELEDSGVVAASDGGQSRRVLARVE